MIVARDAPAQVRTAIILLWVSSFVILIRAAVDDYLSNMATAQMVAIVLAIYGLVIFRASRRHNWARYVLLIWAVLGVGINLTQVINSEAPWWDNTLMGASYALEFAGIYMLFTSSAAQWYRRNLG